MSSESNQHAAPPVKRTFYKIPSDGKVAGVCAGAAEYFGFEVWIVRVVMASAILLTGVFGLPLLAYIVAWFILDEKPTDDKGHYHEEPAIAVKSKVWQKGEPPQRAFYDIRERFSQLEDRLRGLETYVTSKEYQLRREINKL